MGLTIPQFRARKGREKLVMATCYDAAIARLLAATPVDAFLVGDSVAMTVHGFATTHAATLDMMVTHTAAVRRGAPDALIVADLPFFEDRRERGAVVDAVARLVRAGAQAVKLEGAGDRVELIRHLVAGGVPIMGHLGLTPQSLHALGGYRIQGRKPEAAERMRADAEALAEAGCFGLVLECVPAELAAEITAALPIPVIGIGAGRETDGQVLVYHDLLGLDPTFRPRFARAFADGTTFVRDAVTRYAVAVRSGEFPAAEEILA